MTPSRLLRLIAGGCFVAAGVLALAGSQPWYAVLAGLIAAGLLWSALHGSMHHH